MKIRIVSKTGCPFCVKAKEWFDEHGFIYTEDLMDNENERLAFYQSMNNIQ